MNIKKMKRVVRKTITTLYYKIRKPILHAYEWLDNHINPNHRYHVLDLRQKRSAIFHKEENDPDHYEYGWLDPDVKILYAMMNILKEYLETNNLVKDFETRVIQPDTTNPYEISGMPYDNVIEARAILYWWEVLRKVDNLEKMRRWEKYQRLSSHPPARLDKIKKAYLSFKEQEEKIRNQEDEMLHRLINIRAYLWD